MKGSRSRSLQAFLDCGPGSSAHRHDPPARHAPAVSQTALAGIDELANRAIHNRKVVWRCENIFPNERAPLRLFGGIACLLLRRSKVASSTALRIFSSNGNVRARNQMS
jgi:hypothetical protein